METEIDRISLERSEATRQFTDALLRNIDMMAMQFANQSTVGAGLAQKDVSKLYEAAIEFGPGLQQKFPSSYAVKDIFVYSLQGGTIQVPLPSSSSTPSTYKLDVADLQTILGEGSKEDRWVVKTRPGSTGKEGSNEGAMLEFIRPLPILGTSVDGALVVVIDPKELFQSPFLHREGEKLWVQLPDGQTAYDTRFGTTVSKHDLDKVVQPYMNGKLSFQVKLQDGRYNMQVIDSMIPHWKYMLVYPVSRPFGIGEWIVVLLLLVIAVAASHKAVRIFKQISSSMSKLREILAQRGKFDDPARDEFAYLLHEVNGLVERTEQLSELFQQSEVQKKQIFIQELLTEASVYSEERMANLRHYGIAVTNHGYFVVVFRIDDYFQFIGTYSKADQKLLRYFIAKIAEEQLAAQFVSFHADVKEREVIVIANLIENMPIASARNLLLQEVNSICQYIHSYLDLTVSLGIGDLHTDIGCITESFHQALEALEFRVYKGTKALTPIWHVKKNHHQTLILLYNERKEMEQEWVVAINSNNRAMIATCLKKIEHTIKNLDSCPLSLIHHTLWEFVLMMLYHTEASGQERQIELEKLQKELYRFETLEEIMLWMEAAADQWLTRRNEAATNVNWTAVDHMLEYIQANHDKDISLNGMADQLNLDASYLSRLFKQGVGMNFIDYLVSMRIRRAKMLLLTTDHSIQTIGAMVGYHNVTSFNRAFKKEANMTPGQFRANHDPKLLDAKEIY
ncbi:helix-turn-helix domain-containing protein [Paenibacillus piri]|uniref:helix-turn-helix domain-containing protein n=1 Tax=Paenibacillus piri TaxID=2547395 RepID=UPI00140522A3|nr:helix-turn-helix domain-containing protein [Paenibacillus piri]